MVELAECDRAWEGWFAQAGIAPLTLDYEALAADPEQVLRQVLAFLGCDPDKASGVAPHVGKLADAVSQEWMARFVVETRGS